MTHYHAPLPARVLDSWTFHASWQCKGSRSCGSEGVYASGRSRICAGGNHQWNAVPGGA